MNLAAKAVTYADSRDLPDFMLRAGIWGLCARTRLFGNDNNVDADAAFAREMASQPIALNTDDANAQHYEIPAIFFGLVLGPHRKYSCCLFDANTHSLGDAERLALEETCSHAELRDGQTILELGCGWGSLSLFMAKKYPNSRIVSISNSQSQRRFIETAAAERGLKNLSVATADMNEFDIAEKFDRIVSIEMFEHMSNWRALLTKARGWLKHDGRMFIHVFTHRAMSYRFDHQDPADWIGQHFFTGGVMPGHGLVRQFPDLFRVEEEWVWNGENYARTARSWLANFDSHRVEIDRILRDVYGDAAPLWRRRWRMFFLATEGLFGHAGGREWAVSHYRLAPA